MSVPSEHAPGSPECWKHIGIWGDRSCPELTVLAHCHGCPVFSAAGRSLFERELPEGYEEEWRRRLARAADESEDDFVSVLLLDVGAETLALSTRHLREVVRTRRVHVLPHRTGDVFRGLVNVHGRFRPCVSLEALLGIPPVEPEADRRVPAPARRMLVVKAPGGPLVIPIACAHGTERVKRGDLVPPPATLSRARRRRTQSTFEWRGLVVGLLDGEAVLAELEGALS